MGGGNVPPKSAIERANANPIGESVRMSDGSTWQRKRAVTSSTTPRVVKRMEKIDFNEAVRRAAYGVNGDIPSVNGQETTVRNDRDAAKQVAKYQELSRNPTLKNIKAAARIYNGLEQNNYHDALESARRGATSKDISKGLTAEINRDLVKRRNAQRARRMKNK